MLEITKDERTKRRVGGEEEMKFIRWISQLICFHKWKTVRINSGKAFGLSHLHPLAGLDCDCIKCGKQWRDAWINKLDHEAWPMKDNISHD